MTENHQAAPYGVAVLLALTRLGKHVYGGTVRRSVRTERRAKNRAAKRARRANR